MIKPLLSGKLQIWIQLRSALNTDKFRDLSFGNSIWIHASSGEIEYAKALILALKNKTPNMPIVVTYSSASAEKLFDNIRPSVDAFVPAPWDDSHSIKRFIKKINPVCLIISRTDLWPEMIYQCSHQKIKLGLVSYFPQVSFLNRALLKSLLKKFNFISCVDEATEVRLKKMKLPQNLQINVNGDTRFDQVFLRLAQGPKFSLTSTNNIFTFGSTWPEDEAKIEPLMAELIKNQQQLILSPHDVSETNLNRIYLWLKNKKFNFQKLSENLPHVNFHAPILLIDRIGYLADAYRFSAFAFVGGSFKSKVHSVMEPLCCGIPVLVGPHINNSPEAIKYSSTSFQNFIIPSFTSEELIANYNHLCSLNLPALKSEIIAEMIKNKGVSKPLAEFILNNFLRKEDS